MTGLLNRFACETIVNQKALDEGLENVTGVVIDVLFQFIMDFKIGELFQKYCHQ